MSNLPKIKFVVAKDNYHLILVFDGDIKRDYDCHQILVRPEFAPLYNKAFFKSVKVDVGGYGISWNDQIDLSEYELWHNSRIVESSVL